MNRRINLVLLCLSLGSLLTAVPIRADQLDINWVDRASTNLTPAQRLVVDAALHAWERALPVPEPRRIDLRISAAPLVTAVGQASGFQFDPLGNPLGADVTFDLFTDWFVDPTPEVNEEYQPGGSPGHLEARTGSPAAGRWDFLSTALHEVGHAVGFGASFDRFASRVVTEQAGPTYFGDGFSMPLGDAGHVDDRHDLMGLPGYQPGERSLISGLDLQVLNDAYDYADTRIVRYQGPSLPVPPWASPQPARATFDVNEHVLIADLDVALRMSHTWDADLDIFIVDPHGTRVELSTDNGSLTDDYGTEALWTRFDDESMAYDITDYEGPFPGTFRPEGILALYDGTDAFGSWSLEIFDDLASYTGTLYDASLIFTTVPEPGSIVLWGIAAVLASRRQRRRQMQDPRPERGCRILRARPA